MTNISTWQQFEQTRYYEPLTSDLEVDFAIIGGGLAGLLLAYQLRDEGSIAILEKDKIGSGATALTTAFLTQSIDTDPTTLQEIYGKEARLIYESHAKGIDLIESIVKKEKIDCEFTRCDNYIFANTHKQYLSLQEESNTLKDLGVKNKLRKDDKLNFLNFGYILIPDQAKFHPLKFLYALAVICEKSGVKIFENTECYSIKDDEGIRITTRQAQVRPKKVIIATYDPLGNPKETFAKKGMYVTYVYEATLRREIPEGIYEDVNNPYHYFRIDGNRIIVGGEDHREELAPPEENNLKALKEFMNDKFGSDNFSLVRRWKGPILEPTDGLPLIGEYKPDHFVACAFSGNGMTYSAITALMLSDLITGKQHEWQELYNPRRIPSLKSLWKKGRDYTEELFGGAVKNAI